MKSLRLPHCWVCGLQFSDSGGPSENLRHEHHIIPRAAGGIDGPTVSLCDTHHQLLHKVAVRLIDGKEYFDLLTRDVERDKKLLFLASRVQVAMDAVKNDPNKRVLMPLSFEAPLVQKLAAIADMHRLSRANTLKLLIEQEYQRIFPRK